ncbi:MAG: LssY C-terminal domain-containing protein [Proteobacteria bacterium]|nr:LssY C-terminal domain-containing protein [Pseudomonadota bacterium]MBU1138281.1 LssY C-terminal domain-containing protein [Pseudomonadota bacterium]
MATDLIDKIIPAIEHFSVGGYWIAFFAALLETTIGIGLILPGSTIILFLGALSARGYLDPGDLIWFSVLGAILGDNVNYYLGRKYGSKWLKGGFWLLKGDHIEKAEYFMDTHGAKSIFLGRFIPSVKEIVPFIAGSLRMNPKIFMFWNILGAAGWGFVWVLAGYIFAQSLNLAELWLSRAGLLFAFFLIFGGFLYFLKWLILSKGKLFWNIFISICQSLKEGLTKNEHVLLWMQRHPRGISFLQARFDRTLFSGLTLSIMTLAFIYVLILFAGIMEDLITSDPIIAADTRIASLFVVLRTDFLTTVFSWITLLGKSQVILVFIFISIALLWLWQKKNYIFPLFLAVSGSEAFTYLGKVAFHRPRPELSVYAEHSFSFPSGHATIAVAFYGFVCYLLMRFSQSWQRKVNLFFATILLILSIGFSRIYLGVHYISDVWSGFLVGAMWLLIAVSFSEWFRMKRRSDQSIPPVDGARPISILLLFTAVLFYTGFSMYYHPPLASVPAKNTIAVSKSTDIFTTNQMKYTETVSGRRQEPINFIFLAKDDSHVLSAFRLAGWTLSDQADMSSFYNAVKALIFNTPHPSAPISPSFWNAKIQDIGFAKVPGANWLRNARHIKIWRTDFLLKNGKSIYVAMVNANDGFKWGIIPKIAPDLDTERELLYLDLNETGKIESHQREQLVIPLIGKNFIGDQFFSDGKVYIISLQ